jgi:large subunit ribosomal protein L13
MNHKIDAAGKKLGRIAAEAADVLRGKKSVYFSPNIKPDIQVTVENAEKIFMTEKKQKEKRYQRYSGYPSGLKEESLEELKNRRGIGEIIRKAVYGMLPKNKLRAKIIKNLIVKA